MKRTVIFIAVWLPLTVHSQDFQNICSPETTYYHSPAFYLKAFRMDSAIVSGINDTTFYSYRTILDVDTSYCMDTIGGSILGRKVFKRHDGWFFFFNRDQDTVFLNSQGTAGSVWKFSNLPNNCYLQAQITSIITDTILGIQDQVKVITLQAKNSNNINIPHIFNQKQIKLSNHYGLSLTYDFWLFPADTVPYKIAGKTCLSLGTGNLRWQEIYNYDTGDVFHYQGSFNSQYTGGVWSKILTVLDKVVYGNNDSVEYIMEYCKHEVVGYPPEYYNTYDTITVKYNWTILDINNAWAWRLQNEFAPSGGFSDGFFQNINVFNGRQMKGHVINGYYFYQDSCWMPWGGWGYPYLNYHFTEGLGLTLYSYYVIPQYIPEELGENLVYFKKGTETWGIPVSPNCSMLVDVEDKKVSFLSKIHIFPNPVSTQGNILIDNLDLTTNPEIVILDLYGRQVFHSLIQTNPFIINRGNIPAGMYMINIKDYKGVKRPSVILFCDP